MIDEIKKYIAQVKGSVNCRKDFKCLKSDFKDTCKARYSGEGNQLECLEEEPLDCKFSVLRSDLFFCQCPIRAYIAEKLKE
ncbi:MAG: hypothetical protein Q8L26_02990 [Candidatus Omnitrophota bacterium]|nr:hypothetical protein [Candidatus Omnitrophota bacterium]